MYGVTNAGVSGIDRFDELLDTFTYLGRNGQYLRVNSSETGLETISISVFSVDDKVKLDGIETGAQVNVNADWNETNPASKKFIENKPLTIGSGMIDFPRLAIAQKDFELPTGITAKQAFVNGGVWYPLTDNNVSEVNTFTQIGTTFSFKTIRPVNNYIVIYF